MYEQRQIEKVKIYYSEITMLRTFSSLCCIFWAGFESTPVIDTSDTEHSMELRGEKNKKKHEHTLLDQLQALI